MVVSYSKQQFILELKLWYGDVAHKKAYNQLYKYLQSKNMNVGYLLTFDFRQQAKPAKPKWVNFEGKRIFDCVVRVGKFFLPYP